MKESERAPFYIYLQIYPNMTLLLENNTTKVQISLKNLTELGISAVHYVFDINLPEGVDSGEYNYTLFDDQDKVVALGLLQIGSFVPEKKSYTAQNKQTYKQYEG